MIKKQTKEHIENARQGRLNYYKSHSRKGIRFNTGRTHFKKGMITWNVGKKMPKEAILKMIETKKRLFKEGKIETWNKGKFGIHSEDNIKKIVRAQSNKLDKKDYCEICKDKNVTLERHHWKYENNIEGFKNFNTLCVTCHEIQHIKDFPNSKYGGII